jgi:hypothetical protein
VDQPFAHRFTQDEATALLDELRPLVHEMRNAHATLRASQARLHDLMEKAVLGGGSRIPPELMRAGTHLEKAVLAIQRRGVVIKDVAGGLLDFPSERDGRPVFLCWKPGEPAVGFWHDVEEGYAGRQPLEP